MIEPGRALALATAALLLGGCPRAQTREQAGGGQPSPPADDRPVVLCVGTSLTAGLGLDPEQAYPALLQAKAEAAGLPYRFVNAGVSGETSAGALRRIEWLLQQRVDVLVLETGANDGLRGQDPAALRANMAALFDRSRRRSPPPRLVLLGMEAPPNYGPDYAGRFRAAYRDVAREYGAVLVPFLLEGVGGMAALNQADGIHPTPQGQRIIAETVWKYLLPVLQQSRPPSAR